MLKSFLSCFLYHFSRFVSLASHFREDNRVIIVMPRGEALCRQTCSNAKLSLSNTFSPFQYCRIRTPSSTHLTSGIKQNLCKFSVKPTQTNYVTHLSEVYNRACFLIYYCTTSKNSTYQIILRQLSLYTLRNFYTEKKYGERELL